MKMRFGRCPYCRTMIYQNPNAVIYYCSKCRTPIRGKNPELADETLSRLEILSADTASVFSSDELDASSYTQTSVIDVDHDHDQPPLLSGSTSYSKFIAVSQEIAPSSSSAYSGFSSARAGSNEQDDARSLNKRVDELRPSSRRTRRPSSSSDLSVADSDEGSYTRRNACGQQQPRWRSLLSSQELGTPVAFAGPEPSAVAALHLTDPAFHRELLQAMDNLRNLIAAIEQPWPASSARAVTRRDSRFFRRLESQLAQAMPVGGEEHAPRRNASTGSSTSSSERPAIAWKHQYCRPILGGAPFMVCGSCSELLQVPTMAASRRRSTGLRCGRCEEVLELTPPAGVADHAQ